MVELLIFNKEEMIKILDKIETKSGERGHSFWFLFNSFDNKIGFSVVLFVQVFYINMFWKIKLKK